MKMTQYIINKTSFSYGLAVALAFAVWLPGVAYSADQGMGHAGKGAKGMNDMMQMHHISTQAEAEALQPGDSMSMSCSKCKDVMVQKVTTDKAHVKMMTVGEKTECPTCDGTVEVVATGEGTGKNAKVKHNCSKCGDDAMFCSATKPGSGSMKGMGKMMK